MINQIFKEIPSQNSPISLATIPLQSGGRIAKHVQKVVTQITEFQSRLFLYFVSCFA